jgi:arsenate reductase
MSTHPTLAATMTTDATSAARPPAELIPEAMLHSIAQQLAGRFTGVVSPETVDRLVFESYATLRRTARITGFLPVLAQRFATERLIALGQARGVITKEVPEVLMVCVHNAGRSQMAGALLAHHAGERVHVRSAGSLPANEINPLVVQVLAEIGLDLGEEFPKPLTDDVIQAADVVITMGCGDACAIYPGKHYLDWEVPDPEGQPLDTVRAIRDDLDRRVQDLLTDLLAAPAT